MYVLYSPIVHSGLDIMSAQHAESSSTWYSNNTVMTDQILLLTIKIVIAQKVMQSLHVEKPPTAQSLCPFAVYAKEGLHTARIKFFQKRNPYS